MLVALLATAWARPASNGFVDDATHPIRCHWERAADEARCADILGWASLAWDVQVDQIGFAAPLPDEEGGSDALDIYLGVSSTGGAGEAWVDCDGGDGTCRDADPTDGRAGAPSYVVIDARTADARMPGYVVHEFNHTLQYATDYAEPFLSVWEGTAVAAEAWSLPGVDPSADDIGDYQATPWMSAVLQDGYFLWDEQRVESWYEYGAMVWVRWMGDRYTDGAGTIGPLLWETMTQEGMGTEPDVLDAWEAIAGGPWHDEMLAFAAHRARMGGEDGPAWLAFAGEQGIVAREEGSDGDLGPATALYPLGAAYFDVPVSEGATVRFSLAGDAGVDWGLVVVEGPDGIVQTEPEGAWVAAADGVVTLGVVNLGPPGMDADDPLTAASFVLTVTTTPAAADDTGAPTDEAAGCGCAGTRSSAGTGLSAGWGLAIALALTTRRRR